MESTADEMRIERRAERKSVWLGWTLLESIRSKEKRERERNACDDIGWTRAPRRVYCAHSCSMVSPSALHVCARSRNSTRSVFVYIEISNIPCVNSLYVMILFGRRDQGKTGHTGKCQGVLKMEKIKNLSANFIEIDLSKNHNSRWSATDDEFYLRYFSGLHSGFKKE